jgi:mannose/fructose/N-acetylgalactosamine-specific phosphotransferase system component IIC
MTHDTESTGAAMQLVDANTFTTIGAIRISYSRTSITGAPLFSYKDAERDLNFQGEAIARVATAVGELVTVTIEDVPDAFVRSITMVVPDIRLANGDQVDFTTIAVETINHAGAHVLPPGPAGVLQSNQIHELRGSAQFVVS